MIRIFSRGVRRIPYLESFLGSAVSYSRLARPGDEISAVAGWGLKMSALRARRFAIKHGYPYLALEDGFLRSVGLGHVDPPLAVTVDDVGVYYDARRPSRLERQIAQPLDNEQSARAHKLINAWREGRVSKYNHLREYSGELPERYVLVVDQTFGDASIEHGLADADSFHKMLNAALEENPDCRIIIKIHPDVLCGKKRAHFDVAQLQKNSRIKVLADDVHPVRLIEQAEAIYVVTSQVGFEGLLWGRRVRTFGMPFYAGWGLTVDELPMPARRHAVPLQQLVHATLVDYPRYISPETGERCEVEQVMRHLALQRRMRERFPPTVYALGFSLYKRPIVRRYFWGSRVRFVRRLGDVPKGASLAVWGGALSDTAHREGVNIIRLEDGFLRSVGLGADLIQPLSWVMDQRGIYFDARQPSDLEHLLQTGHFAASLVERGADLRRRLSDEGLTKYNVGEDDWVRPKGIEGNIILVPGQVESDASLAYGAPEINTNMALLRAVREANTDAYIIYKPHPDVVAGLRKSGRDENEALRWCDEVLEDVPMGGLLLQVDEVHTLTSLAGFEALLRGRRVVCYGRPFYAGWGLTTDQFPILRRTRKLTLDELVAGVLILYPTYVSRLSGRFTTPEQALYELALWRKRNRGRLGLWRRGIRWVLSLRKT